MKPAAASRDRHTGAAAGEDHGGAMAEPSRDILNALLDQIEGAVELVERHGGGAALRARLARLLPATATVSKPETMPATSVGAELIDRRMQLARVLTALRIARTSRLSETEALMIANAKRWVLDELKLSQGDAA